MTQIVRITATRDAECGGAAFLNEVECDGALNVFWESVDEGAAG
jgi:hypothetical protein